MEKKHFFVHPKCLILLLLIFAISALFFGFTGAYLYSRIQGDTAPIKVPYIIYINSIWLILSSLSLLAANKAYEADETNRYKLALGLTLLFSIAFFISQIFGWYTLIELNLGISTTTMSSYFYLISGLHLAHLLIGLPFLLYFFIDAIKNIKTPISVLIYFSDNEKKLNLKLLNTYWHFLDILWLYLLIFFTINYIF